MSRKKSREYAFRLVFEKFFHEPEEEFEFTDEEFVLDDTDKLFVVSVDEVPVKYENTSPHSCAAGRIPSASVTKEIITFFAPATTEFFATSRILSDSSFIIIYTFRVFRQYPWS